MDFLDPRARRAHRRRLKIGYALMAVLVGLGTLVFLYLAEGWFIDRKTGVLIQNGIVFVDSKPGGARVYVNDKLQSRRTDTRLALPAGVYTVRIELDGYRNWERTFNLEGGELERLVYPFLLPNKFETSDVAQYDIMPALAMQSPDRRWLLVQRPGQTYRFDMFDLNSFDREPVSVIVPPAILTNPGAEARLVFEEWSTDNRHVLLRRDFDDGSEYIMFDREQPDQSVNLNTSLGISPEVISLKNKRPDQFYYLETVPGVLRVADTRNRTISAPLINSVIDYKSYGDDIILYVTQDEVANGKAEFRIFENDQSYTLKQVSQSDRYVLDVSRYDGQWYYAVGSSADNMAFVYQNPLAALKRQSGQNLNVTLMRLDNPRFVSFSANTQFIGLQSGSRVVVLDLEHNQQYRYDLEGDVPMEYQLKWMDGHRFLFTLNQQSYIVDFDGSNEQTLVTSRLAPGPFFDRDYDNVFTFEESKADGAKKALTRTVVDD